MKPTQPTIPPGTAAAASPPHCGGEAAPLSPWREKLFRSRQAKLNRFNALVAAGLARGAACAEVGCGWTTMWRWQKRVEQEGIEGLIPLVSKGAPPILDPAMYTPAVVSALQRACVRCGSLKAGARLFAQDKACPAPLKRWIVNRDSLPEKLRSLVGLRRTKRTIRCAGPHFFVEGLGLSQQNAA